MAKKGRKRSPIGDADQLHLVQTMVSPEAWRMLEARADQDAISRAAVVRQFIYQGLGLMKKKET